MKKTFVFGAISLLLLAVVLSGCATGKAVPDLTSQKINAHECRADEKCEMNDGSVSNTLYFPAKDDSSSDLMINSDKISIRGGVKNPSYLTIKHNQIEMMGHVESGGTNLMIQNGDIILRNGGAIIDFLDVRKQALFEHLAGEGNAYACLDARGNLYRSATPCK